MCVELAVQFLIGLGQLDATSKQSIGNGIFTGQDAVLDVVPLPSMRMFSQICFGLSD